MLKFLGLPLAIFAASLVTAFPAVANEMAPAQQETVNHLKLDDSISITALAGSPKVEQTTQGGLQIAQAITPEMEGKVRYTLQKKFNQPLEGGYVTVKLSDYGKRFWFEVEDQKGRAAYREFRKEATEVQLEISTLEYKGSSEPFQGPISKVKLAFSMEWNEGENSVEILSLTVDS